MSLGHPHSFFPQDQHYRELARLEQLPWFKRGRLIIKTFDRSHDTPWLGGSSINLRRIYADPRFRGIGDYGGHQIQIARLYPALIEHEEVEGILLVLGRDGKGERYHYDGAHEIATAAEIRKARPIIESLGLRWNPQSYQRIFRPFLGATTRPPWRNIATDLNLEPYRDDAPALYAEIETAIRQQQVGDAQKYTKEEVGYSRGREDSHCGESGHFGPVGMCANYISDTGMRHPLDAAVHGCKIVQGRIKPDMWCRRWIE